MSTDTDTQPTGRTDAAVPVPGFRYLERRPRNWRRQPYLKGRNLPVGTLIWKMQVAGHTPETAAEDYEIPITHVREALAYYERHRDVIERDRADERAELIAQGVIQAP